MEHIIFLGTTAEKEAISKVRWCLRTVARNVNMMVRYGFNVDRAYWDGSRVRC